jgi:exodeoxyribonuclease-3
MRIISWNCKMAYRNKKKSLLQYAADLVVIPECEKLGRNNLKRIWFGNNKNKGLGIFSHSDYRLRLCEDFNQNIEYVVPIKVEGMNNYNLLAVWAMNDKRNVQNRYIGQVWTGINYYRKLLVEPTIIIGDFNWNRNFDQNPSYPLAGDFSDVITFLEKVNMTSAYHEFTLEDYGQETQPTLFFHHKEDKPFHVDYCFVSKDFKIEDVEVGKYSDWIKESDHVPLIVTLAFK